MENDSSKLVDDLENGDFLNEIIENNREMDNLILESDFVLETAESELKATIKDTPSVNPEEEDDTSSALSIEVSEDLFKGLTYDLNFSPIKYSSVKVEDTKFKVHDSLKKTDSSNVELNNLLDDFNATLKTYNDVCQQERNDLNECNEFNDDNDKTLIADPQEKDSSDTKIVNIKSVVSFNSDEENDYLFMDSYTTTLEITIPNNEEENLNHTKILSTRNYFEGCSEEFDNKCIENNITVIVNTEQNHSKTEEPITSDNQAPSDDNVAIQEIDPEEIEKIPDFISMENEDINTAHDNVAIQEIDPEEIEKIPDFISMENADINTARNSILLEQHVTVDKICVPINMDSEFAEDDPNISFDHIVLEPNDTKDKISEKTSEIASGDMSETFRNFIQSELNDSVSNEYDQKDALNKQEAVNIEVTLQNNNNMEFNISKITESATGMSTIEEGLTLNENNNIITEYSKRPAEDITIIEKEAKKPKLDEKLANTDAPESSKANEINIISDDSIATTADINFTQAIFDHEETADNNDPKWSVLKELETNEDYFKSVRTQWRSLSLPNPNKNNTTRYVPANIAKTKSETVTSSENERAISCGQFLEDRIQNILFEICALNAKLNRLPRFKSRSERHKLNNELEHLRHLKLELEKYKEELKHINMFYYNDSQGWNANFLTKPELKELEEQDQVLKFQKNFYK